MLVFFCTPGNQRQPAGVILLDKEADLAVVKLKNRLSEGNEFLVEYWSEFAKDLAQHVLLSRGEDVFNWLASSAGHVVQVSEREPIEVIDIAKTLEILYEKYIGAIES